MPHIYEIKTEQFSGPLEKLLELIESQQMNITSVSLASVTADFLHYLNHLQTAETANPNLDKDSLHRLISDFIVVASRLLLIKSKHLLPQIELTPEEETEIFDLEERLKIYKEIKLASIHVKSLWTDNRHSSARDLFQNKPPIFYPPSGLDLEVLTKIVSRLASVDRTINKPIALPKTKIISLSVKIKELLERINKSGSFSFSGLTNQKQKAEVVAFFLAILHLIRDRSIDIEQDSTFGDVIIKKHSS